MKRSYIIAILSLLTAYGYAQDKPNILWIVQEDTSPWMGCYGYEVNKGKTPVVDKLAGDGVLFTRAYVPAPVCSPCRSSFIVGAYQFRFGAHEHRSRRGKAAASRTASWRNGRARVSPGPVSDRTREGATGHGRVCSCCPHRIGTPRHPV